MNVSTSNSTALIRFAQQQAQLHRFTQQLAAANKTLIERIVRK